jgi:hypothetical protein
MILAVEEAVRILAETRGTAKVLSGGTDLLVQLRSGRAKPALIARRATALGFTAAAATIGAPVCARLAAISLSDSGSKSPTLLLAGLAQPSSQTTPSGSTSHILAARTHNSWINFLAVSTTAMPVAKVTREPPVRCV